MSDLPGRVVGPAPESLPGKIVGPAPGLAPKEPESYTGTFAPFRKDAEGIHLAVPEIIASPFRSMAEMGKRALGIEEQGQNPLRPLTGEQTLTVMGLSPAGVLSKAPVAAIGAADAAKTIVSGIGKENPKQVETLIDSLYSRAIKPSVSGKQTASQVDRYGEQVKSAVSSIVENKPNLRFVDEAGETVNHLPKSIEQFAEAIEQTKEGIFQKYDALAQQAGSAGARVDLSAPIGELGKIASDPVMQTLRPEIAAYAESRAAKLKEIGSWSVTDAQRAVQNLNTSLKAFYKNPTYETAARAGVDAVVANHLRAGLDAVIEQITAPGYQALKNQYGSLKAIEKDVVHRSIVDARKNLGGGILGNLSDVASAEEVIRGFLTLNPSAVARGAALKGWQLVVRKLRDPNRAVQKMFEAAERGVKKSGPVEDAPIPVISPGMQPPRPTGGAMPPQQPGTPPPPGGMATSTAPIPVIPAGVQPPLLGGGFIPAPAPGTPAMPGGYATATPAPTTRVFRQPSGSILGINESVSDAMGLF